MALNKQGSTTTTTGLNLGGLPPPSSTSSSTNPTGATAEDQMKVSGVGAALRLNWGTVTVATAVAGLQQLAAAAHADGGKSAGAQAAAAELAAIQQDLYTGGFYGRLFKPTLGTLSPQDLVAFKAAAVGAASQGQDFTSYLTTKANSAQANGTAGGGTHIIPAARVEQKVWAPQDIQSAVDAATAGGGENLAQKLIGRNFSQAELQDIANVLNTASGTQASADAASILAQQQTDIASSQAVYGIQANVVSPLGNTDTGTGTQSFLNAIKQHESGGNYQATNPNGGASGAYQFIQSTWDSEAKAAGYAQYAGKPAAQAPAQVQDAVASYMANNFYKQYGSWEMAARAWYDPAYVNQPNFVPPGNNGLSIGAYGQDIVKLMGQGAGGGATGGAGGASAASGGLFSPVSGTLKKGRTDQGVDYSGKGTVFAVGSGTILSITNSGWNMGGSGNQGAFIALKLDNPPDPQHSVVYYAEDIMPSVKVGQHVSGGAQLGNATGGPSGIEIGWGDPAAIGQALAARSGGYTEGVATAQGQNFLSFINGSTISGTGTGGNKGQTTDVYQQPVIADVPATLDPLAAATNYAENQMPLSYQSNKLLNVFGMIQNAMNPSGSAPTPLAAPIST